MKKKKSAYRLRVEERDKALYELGNLRSSIRAIQNWIKPQGINPLDILEGNEEPPDIDMLNKPLGLKILKKEILAIKVFA